MLLVASMLFGLVLVAGVAVLLVADTDRQRWVGVAVAVGAPLGWLWAAMPCMAARAIGRYIEERA